MLKRFGFATAVAVVTTSAAGQDANPAHLTEAMEIADAIRYGENPTTVEGVVLSRVEYAELSKLAGCDTTVVDEDEKDTVVINWSCGPSTMQPGLARTVTMHFNNDDELRGLAINAVISNFAPSEGALLQRDQLPKDTTAKSFAKAVVGGRDPTLSGYIPLDDYGSSRLAYFAGGKFRVRSQDGRVWRLSFRDPKGDWNETYLHFDAQGRPIGIIFDATYCSYCQGTAGRNKAGREATPRDRRDETIRRERKSQATRERASERRRTTRVCPSC